MANQRVKRLLNSSGATSGAITVNTVFGKKFYGTLTGNVTLTMYSMNEGDVVSFWLTQDGTGSRTLTINPASGGANIVIGPSTAIASAAGKVSKVVVAKINNVHNIEIIAQA